MNQHLQSIFNFIQQDDSLSADEKSNIIKLLKDANKELQITSFKLDRTEKVKHTTAILLEKTIEELEQKRKAVEDQKRELEIEAALERVRTVAMSMREAADMPDVCHVISAQLETLNVKEIRNVQTAIFYKEKGTYMNYEYYAKHDKTFITETSYTNSEMHKAFAAQMMKGAGESFATHMNGEEVRDWISYQKTTNVFIDDYLYTASSLNYYWHSLGPVALGISTYYPLKEEEKDLFRRFVKVFELAYRRYLDIEKAEANAREATVEAALEKVRSRSLAVHKSDEFKEVITVVFEKLQELGIVASSVSINIFIEGSKDAEAYICGQNEGEISVSHIRLLYFDHPISNDRYNAQKSSLDFFSKNYSYEEKNSFFEYLFKISDLKYLPDDIKKMVFQSKRYTISMALAQNSMIVVNDFEGGLLSEKEIDILKRFAKVFEQAYVRFLDLQKAEAQAREAKIETALERVRSRSMAMYKSEEVMDVAVTVYDELQKLDFKFGAATIIIMDKETGYMEHWLAGFIQKNHVEGYPVNNIEHPLHAAQLAAWRKGEKFISIELSGAVLKAYAEEMFTETGYKNLPDDEKLLLSSNENAVFNLAYMSHGALMWAPSALSDEKKIILQRFAKVFEQTYTRFLDLQKAEAQSIEAKIQLALERVRARTMAMQRSDELKDAAALLFQQVKSLGVPAYSCGYNIWEKDEKEFTSWMSTQDGSIINGVPNILLTEDANFIRYVESKQNSEPFFVLELYGERMQEHYQYLKTIPAFKGYFDYAESVGFDLPKTQIHHLANFSQGNLLFITLEPCPEFHDVFKRFAGVFEQTYTRFLDLQKAEAQAREAQIQLALERVRARTMAMQHSDELTEAASLLFKQVQLLDFPVVSCGFNIWQKEDKACNAYMSDEAGFIQPPFTIPLTESPVFIHFAESRQKEESFYAEEVSGEALGAHYKYMLTLPVFAEIAGNFLKAGFSFPELQINNVANFAYGNLIFITYKPVPEAHDIFIRFAKVFEQTYTRFLDLQNAEAAAREASIEAALERVRSRTMAMQKSEELKEVIQVVYKQFVQLNIYVEHTGFIMDYKESDDMHIWLADKHAVPFQVSIPYFDSAHWNSFNEAKEKGKDFFANHLSFEEKNKFYQDLFKLFPVPDETKEYYFNCPDLAISTVLLENVGLYIENFSGIPYSDEDNRTLMRFGKVFQQTYTRFNDLKQAEAQSREAQIELGLERVRARAMAMQKSDELAELADTVFKELTKLHFVLDRCIINIIDEKSVSAKYWMANPEIDKTPISYHVPLNENSYMKASFDAWKERKAKWVYDLKEKEKADTVKYIFSKTELRFLPEEAKRGMGETKRIFLNSSFSNFGGLQADTVEPLSEENFEILYRFGKVFDLTYTRFNDLKQAEAQAREAQIEAALEKVRSRSLAMHRSDELREVVSIVCEKLQALDFAMQDSATIIFIFTEGSKDFVQWISEPEGYAYAKSFKIPYVDNLLTSDIFKAREDGKDFLSRLYPFEEKNKYFNFLFEQSDYRYLPLEIKNLMLESKNYGFSIAFAKNSAILIPTNSGKLLTENEAEILKRFSRVFEQAYVRFLDLQKAEAQSRESQIEAALERVRSRTLAMQKSDELAETSAVLFKQLINLGIKPNRLYISIMKDDEGETEFWITDEDGSKVSMAYEDNLNNNPSFKKMYDGWKQQTRLPDGQEKSLVIDMKGKELKEYFNYLSSINVPFKGGLAQKRRVQYIAYFSKGFIGMASPDEQPAATVQLLERFAYVFNLTFTRFNDLQVAEAHAVQAEHDLIEIKAARTKAEETLAELQSTQKQLVQSEKMASLGELTAGIAHEIQNPLNFVNNFSEVSKELIDEMKAALEHGDKEEADAIANDIIQNLEKINHHGKRADAIVKGMLQHSRKSSGQKEPTDINALCDEYIRLCYHGLRAKDKSFNADINTDFETMIEKINVTPQDISRVILNILTNAFYAVNEKKKIADKNYKPTISVQTKKVNNNIEMKVEDNGNGIPQNIIDKIFQPFFTTKPTGQGTGLGLSLAYDIITKEHNGTIKVESKEGEGSKFIINLPVA